MLPQEHRPELDLDGLIQLGRKRRAAAIAAAAEAAAEGKVVAVETKEEGNVTLNIAEIKVYICYFSRSDQEGRPVQQHGDLQVRGLL